MVYGDSNEEATRRFETAQDQAVAAQGGQLVRLDDVADLPWHSATSQDSALNAIMRFTDSLSSDADPPVAQMPGFRTLLFTDLESSTQLTQQLGDAKAQQILDGHNNAVRTALTDHGGDEVKHTGDGIFAAFTSAVSAVEASLQIQRDLAGAEVRVRIGLNAGEPIAQDDDYFGAAVQLAARVCDRAEPGQILVAQVVRDLCRGKTFHFDDQGEATLKGFPDRVRLFVVTPSPE
jgi:adenylate cyclase